MRWNDWKVNFAGIDGNIATGTRKVTGWPLIVNLRADPYEKMPFESARCISAGTRTTSGCSCRCRRRSRGFFGTIPQYPFQEGSSLNAAGINYQTLKAAAALKRLQELETIGNPGN